MRHILILTLILFQLISFGQTTEKLDVYNVPIPKNLDKCFKVLDKTLPDNEIELVKTIREDSIYFNPAFKNGTDFFHAWKLYKGSVLTKYFNKKGLYGTHEIYNTILISYHRHLNKDSVKLEEQIRKIQVKQHKEHEEFIGKTKKDTLNGVYIPIDLKDCFKQLDKLLSDSDKSEIKKLYNKNKTIQYHHSLGMWIRNNWGLWGGSRLQTYLRQHGCSQPDDMSATILEYYYDWLNNRNDDWLKWDNQSEQQKKTKQ